MVYVENMNTLTRKDIIWGVFWGLFWFDLIDRVGKTLGKIIVHFLGLT